MTIPSEWLKAGAIVPVTNETVSLLIQELKNVPHWVKTSNFDEFAVHVRFNVSVPFEHNSEKRLSAVLHSALNASLCDLFRKHNGSYSNPRVDISGVSTSC
jgi:hypothetical protein